MLYQDTFSRKKRVDPLPTGVNFNRKNRAVNDAEVVSICNTGCNRQRPTQLVVF